MMPDPTLITLARQFAVKNGLNDALVCAVCEQESSWRAQATRYEPDFYKRYIVPLIAPDGLSDNEAVQRATSYGLMQVMGQTAREHGMTDPLPNMLEPATGIYWGCVVLAHFMVRAQGDAYKALEYYNGGGNPLYMGQVIARMDKYIQPAIDLTAQDL
jgi:soluble lytic murein transglycosylase-like protein